MTMKGSQYQVIARRWRPKTFAELVGQDHIVRTLSNAIALNRIAHAFLFIGPRGTGKTSTARLLAQALNCENGPSITPNADSEICQAILKGACMDVIEIDGASNNSVDQIRDLRDDCKYAPTQCRFKIYIIDEVHMLTPAAFNALLKTLEEPPAHVKFIFATTESQKILPTIVSRCQRFEFRPISIAVIAKKLSDIAKAEGIQISSEALNCIARVANGGMRDAQSILDQLISFCGNNIEEKDILSVYGLTSQAELDDLTNAIISTNFNEIVEQVDKLINDGRDLFRALIDIQDHFHQHLLAAIKNKGSTDINNISISQEIIARIIDSLREGENLLKTGLSERVNFELSLIKASQQISLLSIDSLINEITQLSLGNSTQKESTAAAPVKKKLITPSPTKAPSTEKTPSDTLIINKEPTPLVSSEVSEAFITLKNEEEIEPSVSISPKKTLSSLSEAKSHIPAESIDLLNQLYKADIKNVVELNMDEFSKV